MSQPANRESFILANGCNRYRLAKLPKGALEDLLQDQEKLAAVLTYHIVPGKVDVRRRQTRQGQDGAGSLTLATKNGAVRWTMHASSRPISPHPTA
ncbi:MAG: fasciclin domain-containing protein [Steroidobacteraceae bacterium]